MEILIFFEAHATQNASRRHQRRGLHRNRLDCSFEQSLIYEIKKPCDHVEMFRGAECSLFITCESCIEWRKFTKMSVFSKWRYNCLVFWLALQQRTIPYFLFYSYKPHPLTWYSKIEILFSIKNIFRNFCFLLIFFQC